MVGLLRRTNGGIEKIVPSVLAVAAPPSSRKVEVARAPGEFRDCDCCVDANPDPSRAFYLALRRPRESNEHIGRKRVLLETCVVRDY